MNKLYAALVLVAAVMVSACDDSRIVRHYCGADMEYTVVKLDSGYELELHVGRANPAVCKAELYRHDRAANLVAQVASVDEALKLVEENRQRYLPKDVAASK